MVYINEWLPNPVGRDAVGEWIELLNGGASAVNLEGWILESGGGGTHVLHGALSPQSYEMLPRARTKLTLRNQDETLSLYTALGELAHQSHFVGQAPEGKSWSRIGENSFFVDPTPGRSNEYAGGVTVLRETYELGKPLHAPLTLLEVIGLAVTFSLLLTAVVFFVIKNDGYLSKLIFKRD